MVYYFLAAIAMVGVCSILATIGAAGYVFYKKVICGSPKSIRELLDEF